MVDNAWFERAGPGRVFGQSVHLVPPEEIIWSKGFVMERERFDGAEETPKKVVMLHYSPILDTCVGEMPEIIPFLGTSRLSHPIDHYGAAVVFHGHSHFGSREGKTPGGVRVLNVAMPLLAKTTPEQRFALVEV